jgi:hypothetical protein
MEKDEGKGTGKIPKSNMAGNKNIRETWKRMRKTHQNGNSGTGKSKQERKHMHTHGVG